MQAEAGQVPDPRKILEKYSIRPKRSLGQNFLINLNAARRIADFCTAHAGSTVVETGPGPGTLTLCLLNKGARVTAVEHDASMIRILESEYGHHEGLSIIKADAAEFDYSTAGSDLVLAGNLPFNAAARIIMNAVSQVRLVRAMVFMVQREVGDRLKAGPGERDYGALSALVQAVFDVRRVMNLNPNSFFPAPKVRSSVMEMMPKKEGAITEGEYEKYRTAVNAAFSKRRKTLRNSLSSAGIWDADKVERALEAGGIDPGRRAETLSVQEFFRLAEKLP